MTSMHVMEILLSSQLLTSQSPAGLDALSSHFSSLPIRGHPLDPEVPNPLSSQWVVSDIFSQESLFKSIVNSDYLESLLDLGH